MTTVPADLLAFLAEQRDSREYRRGLAVKRSFEGWTYETMCSILGCTIGFVSQQKQAYLRQGVAGLRLRYTGSQPLLAQEHRDAVVAWLQAQKQWSPALLRQHIEQNYGVVYESAQSYYDRLHEAKITYKKAQAYNPKRDDDHVAAKKKR